MRPKNTAILIFKDAEVLDFAGPFEVFNAANEASGKQLFNVFLAAEYQEIIEVKNGLRVIPDYTIESSPDPEIIIIPGGEGRKVQMYNENILNWIKKKYSQLELLLSVCTGAFILGKTGLLDNIKATTHHASYDEFAETFPQTELVRNVKYVDNGKIITSGGISAGINMSLYVVGQIAGKDIAGKTAELMEYDVV
jgi:transcriptional regulator GlxA family with amidase domain